MKFSYDTIKKLVPGLSLSASELADLLTMYSFETVIDREYLIDPAITVVMITKLDPHPNADRLRLATVTDGEKEIRVVCGAPNIEVGQVVPYAPPGTQVYDENGELFTLKEATIRGEKSPGMLNSLRELGISDDHGGILILPSTIREGSKLHEYIPSDTILDISILPDRIRDCNSHIALAHEVAALLKKRIQAADEPKLFELGIYRDIGINGFAPWKSEAPVPGAPRIIDLRPDHAAHVAGIEIPREEVRDSLTRLRFGVDDTLGNIWKITVPADRFDVLGEHDVIDEIVRLHGLNSIPPATQKFPQPLPVSQSVYWTGLIRRTLVEAGFTETYSYSFEDERFSKIVNAQIHPHVQLTNPMAPELKNLRYSMLPGLIGAMVKSRDDIHRTKKSQERALFEIGRVYHVGDGGTVPGVIERPVVSGIAVGDEMVLQDIVDRIRALFHLDGVTITTAEKPFASIRQMKYADEFFGIGYIFSDELLKKMKYRMPVIAFEISFNALLKHAPDVEIPVRTLDEIRSTKVTPTQFVELPKYPSVFRDISLLISPSISVEQVQGAIERVGKELVVDVDLFDEFEREGASTKSLAFHIEYRSNDKTLTDAEITDVHTKIEHTLKKEFEAEIR